MKAAIVVLSAEAAKLIDDRISSALQLLNGVTDPMSPASNALVSNLLAAVHEIANSLPVEPKALPVAPHSPTSVMIGGKAFDVPNRKHRAGQRDTVEAEKLAAFERIAVFLGAAGHEPGAPPAALLREIGNMIGAVRTVRPPNAEDTADYYLAEASSVLNAKQLRLIGLGDPS